MLIGGHPSPLTLRLIGLLVSWQSVGEVRSDISPTTKVVSLNQIAVRAELNL